MGAKYCCPSEQFLVQVIIIIVDSTSLRTCGKSQLTYMYLHKYRSIVLYMYITVMAKTKAKLECWYPIRPCCGLPHSILKLVIALFILHVHCMWCSCSGQWLAQSSLLTSYVTCVGVVCLRSKQVLIWPCLCWAFNFHIFACTKCSSSMLVGLVTLADSWTFIYSVSG